MFILHLLHSRKVRQPNPPPQKKYQMLIYSMHKANLSSMTDAVNLSEEAVFTTSFYLFILFFLFATKSTGCQMNIAAAEINCLKGGIQKCKYFILLSRSFCKAIN